MRRTVTAALAAVFVVAGVNVPSSAQNPMPVAVEPSCPVPQSLSETISQDASTPYLRSTREAVQYYVQAVETFATCLKSSLAVLHRDWKGEGRAPDRNVENAVDALIGDGRDRAQALLDRVNQAISFHDRLLKPTDADFIAPLPRGLGPVPPEPATPPATATPLNMPNMALAWKSSCSHMMNPGLVISHGTLTIDYDIDADGTIANVRLAKSSGTKDIDDFMLSCFVERSRYTPQIVDGVAVDSAGHRANVGY